MRETSPAATQGSSTQSSTPNGGELTCLSIVKEGEAAIAGYSLAMIVSWFVVRGSEKGGAAILLPWPVAVGMLGLTLVMCTAAAFVSINKVTRLDPAMVFKG